MHGVRVGRQLVPAAQFVDELACLVFGAASALEVRLQGASLPVSSYVIQMLPYVIALIVLTGLGRRTRMPQAIGRAYQMG